MKTSWKSLIFAAALGTCVGFGIGFDCSAALIWRKGEGWTYESGGVKSGRDPREQLDLANNLRDQKDHRAAAAAYRRVVRRWPTSSASQQARFGLAQSYAALGYHYKAYKEYQQLIEKHPNTQRFEEVLQRQYEIGNLFLAGERDKAWGIHWFPSSEKAIEIFEQVVKNGPYSAIAPEAQFRVGVAHQKRLEYSDAISAYEKLIERYPKHAVAEEAQFQIGLSYKSQASRAEYDQNVANEAINALSDFLVRYPENPKATEAERYRAELKGEQSKGLFRVAEFYEKKKRVQAALIYYNEVIGQNPQSTWAVTAKEKIAKLSPRTAEPAATP